VDYFVFGCPVAIFDACLFISTQLKPDRKVYRNPKGLMFITPKEFGD